MREKAVLGAILAVMVILSLLMLEAGFWGELLALWGGWSLFGVVG